MKEFNEFLPYMVAILSKEISWLYSEAHDIFV